jgi:hypothetical protein
VARRIIIKTTCGSPVTFPCQVFHLVFDFKGGSKGRWEETVGFLRERETTFPSGKVGGGVRGERSSLHSKQKCGIFILFYIKEECQDITLLEKNME